MAFLYVNVLKNENWFYVIYMDSFVFLAILIIERPVNLAVPSGFQQVFSNLEFTLATGIITTEIHKLYAYRFVAVIRQRYTVA